MSNYELPIFILKIITVIVIAILIIIQTQRYRIDRTRVRKYFIYFLRLYLLSFSALIFNQIFLFEIRGLGTAICVIFNSIGNYYLAHFSFELFLEHNYAKRTSVKIFFVFFLIMALSSAISSAIWSWEYYGHTVRNIPIPTYTIFLLISSTLLNLVVYGFLFLRFFRDLRTFNRMSPEDRELHKNQINNIKSRYIFVCVFQFIAAFLLLVDMYLTFFTIYALVGWVLYVIGFILLFLFFGIKQLQPTVEHIPAEYKN